MMVYFSPEVTNLSQITALIASDFPALNIAFLNTSTLPKNALIEIEVQAFARMDAQRTLTHYQEYHMT